ncbi:TatD family hydrolase [Chloroflexota bacterium]
MAFSDSHCHLVRNGTQPEHLAEALEQARAKGVEIIVSMAMTLESSTSNVRLTQSYKEVLAAIGIHPWNAVPPTDELRRDLRQLAGREGIAAIGEIGLDYARNPETKEVQKELLRYELSLARETGLPVSIHCRDAHQDMMDILRQEMSSELKGSVHGFSGDRAVLKDWLDLGFYISIGGRRGVPNEIPALPEVVGDIPLDRLLTESEGTDGPAGVISVAEKLASVLGTTVEQIADATTANLKRLLKL